MRALWAPLTYGIAVFFLITIVLTLGLTWLLQLMEPHTKDLWWLPASYGNGIGLFAAGFVAARMTDSAHRSRRIQLGIISAMAGAVIGTVFSYQGDVFYLLPFAIAGVAIAAAGAFLGSRPPRGTNTAAPHDPDESDTSA